MTTDVIGASVAAPTAGILGAGFMAEVHSRAVRSASGRLAAVASSSPESAHRAAPRLGAGRAYASVDELVAAADIEVVHVCTPNSSHRELALAAIAAGKHVICEKPLATSGKDAAAMAQAAAAAGVVATVPFVYRYHPMVREARSRMATGQIGQLLSIQGSYTQDWLLDSDDDDWRVDAAVGGPSRAFADIGSHLVDLVEFVSGERIVRIAAVTSTVFADRASSRDIATEDLAAVVGVTGAGALVSLFVSQVAAGRKNRLAFEISGGRAAVAFDQESPESLWFGLRDGARVLVRDRGLLSPDAARLSLVPAGHPMGYQDAFNAFVADTYAATAGPAPEGLPTFDDGVRAAHVTDAVLLSARTGDWVDIAGVTA